MTGEALSHNDWLLIAARNREVPMQNNNNQMPIGGADNGLSGPAGFHLLEYWNDGY
ncbi:hypothetical protein D3C85_1900470 [compost metagenome]